MVIGKDFYAQETVYYPDKSKLLNVGKNGALIVEDKNFSFTIDEVLEGKVKFEESKNKNLNFGNTASRFWVHFSVNNVTREKLFLKFMNAELEDIHLFIVKNNTLLNSTVSGLNKDYKTRFLSSNTIILSLDSSEKFDVYFYANCPTAFWCPLEMGSIQAITDGNHSEDLFNGAFIGIMIIMFMFNLLVSTIVRGKVYLIYCCYLLSVFGFIFSSKGFHIDLLWRGHPEWNNFSNIFVVFIDATALWFGWWFLRLKQNIPGAFKIIVGMYVVLIIDLIFEFFKMRVLSNMTLQLVGLINSVLLISWGVKCYRRGMQEAKFFIFAWTVLVSGAFVYTFMLSDLIPVNGFTQRSFQLSIAIETCLLSLALADRIRYYARVTAAAQLQATQIATENARLVREQNLILETKVSERTTELLAEKRKSDNLLLNILPEEIAEELKETGKSEARLYDNVTVLFTDFVNFTGISEKLSPKELLAELNYCFKGMDQIISSHGLEKIKTIGDAYMAASGLPLPNENHAENAIKASFDIIDFINKRKQEGGLFEIRIGLNSGAVVSGIVGTNKFAYDIWGDTVNIASRMESNSENGKINISSSTFSLVNEKFQCEPRGKILAKGKGEIEMFFVSHSLSEG